MYTLSVGPAQQSQSVHSRGPTSRTADCRASHAKNKIAGRCIPFLVLGFWYKNTGICAGAMTYRRDFPATTRI